MTDLSAFSLEGRTVMVTGANTGIGQGIAVSAAKAGAKVLGVGRSDLSETARLIGDAFVPLSCDLADLDAARAMLEMAWREHGTIDGLVNNAGIIRRADALDFSEEDWDAVIDTNLKSVFFLCQAAGRHMVGQGRGKIINIASMLSFQGGIRVPSYTASKSGVAGLTKLLANEWAAKGINVNAIAPGYIATNNTAALQADETRNRQITERIPAGRWGAPSDLGGAAIFLASAASDYVSGHVLAVDGGWLGR